MQGLRPAAGRSRCRGSVAAAAGRCGYRSRRAPWYNKSRGTPQFFRVSGMVPWLLTLNPADAELPLQLAWSVYLPGARLPRL